MSAAKRLSELMKTSKILPFDSSSRIIILSDCHRGCGNWGDNFLKNQNLVFAALTYYNQRKFTYIELGDGDELWENRNMEQIIQVHSDTFWIMSNFYKDKRMYMIYGNHDGIKKKQRYTRRYFDFYFCENSHCHQPLFPELQPQESLILQHKDTGQKLLLAHGHQGDLLNDSLGSLSRFLVRYFWRPLELIGIHDPTSTAKNYSRKNIVEKRLSTWARQTQQILIAGHTHRPMLPAPGSSFYINSGSCIHPRCITGLEIENSKITLVKWQIHTKEDLSLYVRRQVLEGPFPLDAYRIS